MTEGKGDVVEQLRGRAAACGANHQVDAEIDTRAADLIEQLQAKLSEREAELEGYRAKHTRRQQT